MGGVACSSGAPSGAGVTSDCGGKVTAETCLAQCDSGYTHASGSSDANFTCGADGAFVGANLTCTGVACSSGAPSGVGVTSDCGEKVTAETCLAQCETGYTHASGSSDA